MTTSVSHRTGGDVDAQAGQYGQVRYGWYASGGVTPASELAVSHDAAGTTATAHDADARTVLAHTADGRTLQTDGSTDDLTGATVAFTLWPVGSDTPTVDENTANVTVTSAADGQVEYALQTGDLDAVGDYYYEWEVTLSSGEVRTYPNDRDGVPLEVLPEGS